MRFVRMVTQKSAQGRSPQRSQRYRVVFATLSRRSSRAYTDLVSLSPECERLFYISGVLPANRRTEQFAKRANAKFLLRARTVGLYSLQTQMQILRNLRRGSSLAKEPEYFQLAIAQTFHRRTLGTLGR